MTSWIREKYNSNARTPCQILPKCFMALCVFQAEDGIRDLTVTGVQTCALPIWYRAKPRGWAVSDVEGLYYFVSLDPEVPASNAPTSVGSRWSRSNKLAGSVGTSVPAEQEKPDLRSLIKQIRQAAINSRSPFGFEILALIARASPNGSIDHPSVS